MQITNLKGSPCWETQLWPWLEWWGASNTYKRYLLGNSCPMHVLHMFTCISRLKLITMNWYFFLDLSLAKLEGRVTWITWGVRRKYAERDDNSTVCHCCYTCGVGLTVVLEQWLNIIFFIYLYMSWNGQPLTNLFKRTSKELPKKLPITLSYLTMQDMW